MIRTVLCAIDINRPEEERQVIRQAARLAEAEGARLDVITVVPDFGMSVVGGFFDESHTRRAIDHARKLLNEQVVAAIGADANERTRHIVTSGKAYEQILNVANKDDADLIVLGAHQPDLRDYLLGPNAARVVRHAKCSVHVVRHKD